MAPARAERWCFAGAALAVMAFVAFRAHAVPLVHDEAVSFIAYAQSGRFLPFASMWDANNHLLNSLCGHLGYRLFGLRPLALRWASVLSYALYAWCAWRLGLRLRSAPVRWLLWAALLPCPFLLDFFSLFRGYGPSIALFVLALERAIRYAEHGGARRLAWSLGSLAAACGFMLALLPAALLLLAVLLVRARRSRAELALWSAALAPIGLLALLARHMAGLGLLYHGDAAGYLHTTVGSLLRYALGLEGGGWRMDVALAMALLTVLAAVRREGMPAALPIIGALLWGEVVLRWILAETVGLHYAEDRTALHVLVSAILLAAFAMDRLAQRERLAVALALPLLAFPARTLRTAQADRTALWPEQSVPPRFLARIEALERGLGRPAAVGMHRLATIPFALERRMRGGEGDGDALPPPCAGIDAWVAFWPTDALRACGFAVADSAPNGLRLLLRDPPLDLRPGPPVPFALRMSGTERSEGFPIDAAAVRAHEVIAEVRGSIRLGADGADLRLAFAAWDSSGQALFGDHILLATRRGAWHGEALHAVRWIPRLPRAARAEVFLWSLDRAPAALTDGVLRLHAAD